MKSEITQGMKIGAVALISLTAAYAQAGYPQDNQYPAPYPARQQQPAYQQEPVYRDQSAQEPQGRYFTAQELDGLVGRIALHPDGMLAQILTAASYPDQVDALGRGSSNGYIDPAVEGLRQYPQVLQMMTSDMNWTADIGWAFANQHEEVMDAVQRMRRQALDYGNLRSDGRTTVNVRGGYVHIEPADSEMMYLPAYDPYVVYAPPRYGYGSYSAITYGPCYRVGLGFNWGFNRFAWGDHRVFVNNRVWDRPEYVSNRVTNVYRDRVVRTGPNRQVWNRVETRHDGYQGEAPRLSRVETVRIENPRVETRRTEMPRMAARQDRYRRESPSVSRVETPRMEMPRMEARRAEAPRMETRQNESPRMQTPRNEGRTEMSPNGGGRSHGGEGGHGRGR